VIRDISLRGNRAGQAGAIAPPGRLDPAALDALPRTPGVYVFRGEGALPLYIGKSVDIRSRVQAHLRSRDEQTLMARARRVDYIETAGEIGALLLEARMIKRDGPLFNIRLRRLRTLCSIRFTPGEGATSLALVSSHEGPVGSADQLYGLFSSLYAAQSRLRTLADTHNLCLGLLGLEKAGHRGCFGWQLKRCLGACVGHESREVHDQRLLSSLQALKVHAWPYPGPIDLVEQRGEWTQRHRIDDWRFMGTWCSRTRQFSPDEQSGFDLDIYKILVKPLMTGRVRVELPRL
jgi:excinuclease Cho